MLNKRYIALIFLTIFLFSNVGWSINVHSCNGDSFSNISYIHDNQHKCMMEDESETDSCCEVPIVENTKTEHYNKSKVCCKDEVIKSSVTDQSISKTFPMQWDAICPNTLWTSIESHSFEAITLKRETLAYYVETNAPPLYKLYCRLVLYA